MTGRCSYLVTRTFFVLVTLLAVATSRPRVAHACGGCFHPAAATEHTVVTDHRMAFSISPTQTVLWDQIRYSGNPSDFAWVLPVRSGARVELSHDAWFAALDASTQPVVNTPPDTSGGGGGTAGCLAGCGAANGSSAGGGPGDSVQVLSQTVVGPYETVTLRSTDPNALTNWLGQHGYDIPVDIAPVIGAYVSEGFDFIALRLRPLCNEQAMQPVRVVTPGADPTLPLRMVAAGVGAEVGITLFVVTEGRMHPQNFPDATIDFSQLTWSLGQSRSNYQELSLAAMSASNGQAWLTEYSDRPELEPSGYGYVQGASAGSPNPGLADVYFGMCNSPGSGGLPTPPAPCTQTSPTDAGAEAATDGDVGDSTQAEAGSDDGASAEGSNDASDDANDASQAAAVDAAPPPGGPCAGFDDLDVALTGLHPSDVWVTRLRALLPRAALGTGDLHLEATTSQTPVSNVHTAVTYSDGPGPGQACASAPRRTRGAWGSWLLIGLSALGVSALLRRRAG